MGNDGSSSSCSSKKNKSPSNSNSDKPKQPQRGLGVAQLEKIRLHTQMASCGFIPQHHYPPFPSPNFPASAFQEDMRIQAAYHQAALQNLQASSTQFGYGPPPGYPPHPNNMMMGYGEHMERPAGIRFGESQSSTAPRWNPNINNNVAAMPENPQYIQPQGLVTRHLLSHVEQNNRRDHLFESKGSSSRNPEPKTENEELDLELKL